MSCFKVYWKFNFFVWSIYLSTRAYAKFNNIYILYIIETEFSSPCIAIVFHIHM